jgi:hypothetical protein
MLGDGVGGERQAVVEAARRPGGGGAAHGVFPFHLRRQAEEAVHPARRFAVAGGVFVGGQRLGARRVVVEPGVVGVDEALQRRDVDPGERPRPLEGRLVAAEAGQRRVDGIAAPRRQMAEAGGEVARPQYLGIRLLIGAPVRPDREREQELDRSYRPPTPDEAGGSRLANDLHEPELLASNRLSAALTNAIARADGTAIDPALRAELRNDAEEVLSLTERAIRTVVADLVGVALRDAAFVVDRRRTLERQQAAIADMRKLADKVPAMAAAIPAAERRLADERTAFSRDAASYYNTLMRLAEYGPERFRLAHGAATEAAAGLPALERAALALLAAHFERTLARAASVETLRDDLIEKLMRAGP